MGVLAWNIGVGAFSTSTVLKKVNKMRFEEAAEAFLLFHRATLHGGTSGPDGKPARDPNGNVMAHGVSWFKAMRGIYRRSISAALLFAGKHWRDAAAPNRIIMTSIPKWNSSKSQWYDDIRVKSEWPTILADAEDDPLPLIEGNDLVSEETEMATSNSLTIILPENWQSLTEDQKTNWLNGHQKDALKAAKVVGRKKVVEVPNIPTTDEKLMEDSETFRGLSKADSGKESHRHGRDADSARNRFCRCGGA